MKNTEESGIKNIGASVRARLLNIAKKDKRDYNALLLQYAQERFLYRLSQSRYRSKFVLKGALLLLPYHIPLLRPTKDIDFLGLAISNQPGDLKSILQEIVTIKMNDGIEFLSSGIKAELINEQLEYTGIRSHLSGNIGGATFSLQIDIGFGDKIVPGPVDVDFPTLLDYPAPHLQIYSLESAVAEKFEAIVKLNYLTSRMKDFYDIHFLASHHSFKNLILRKALIITFKQRRTNIDDRRNIFNDNFHGDKRMNILWKAFLKRQRIENTLSFTEVVLRLYDFIDPILESNKVVRRWDPDQWQWK